MLKTHRLVTTCMATLNSSCDYRYVLSYQFACFISFKYHSTIVRSAYYDIIWNIADICIYTPRPTLEMFSQFPLQIQYLATPPIPHCWVLVLTAPFWTKTQYVQWHGPRIVLAWTMAKRQPMKEVIRGAVFHPSRSRLWISPFAWIPTCFVHRDGAMYIDW